MTKRIPEDVKKAQACLRSLASMIGKTAERVEFTFELSQDFEECVTSRTQFCGEGRVKTGRGYVDMNLTIFKKQKKKRTKI